jgi:hypothetical protein
MSFSKPINNTSVFTFGDIQKIDGPSQSRSFVRGARAHVVSTTIEQGKSSGEESSEGAEYLLEDCHNLC